MQKPFILMAVAFLVPTMVLAQLIPQSAHVNLYFPHFAVGGSPGFQWQTIFTFTNPDSTSEARALLLTFGDSGGPLALDFGDGLVSVVEFTVPPGGLRVFRTATGRDTRLSSGWAQAVSTMPLQGNVQFRTVVDGVPQLAVNGEATLPSYRFDYPANAFSGFAVANIFTDVSASILMQVRNNSGQVVRETILTVPPNGHLAFVFADRFADLGEGFEGVVAFVQTPVTPQFVAWALSATSEGLISSLPSGRFVWPGSQWDNIWLAFRTVLAAARTVEPDVFAQSIELRISSAREINAFAGGGQFIQINLAFAELISDSPSELAHLVGHELGHIFQQRTGRQDFDPTNKEVDADIWGTLLALLAGYDPYGMAGTLAKGAMVTGSADLVSQTQQLFDGLSIPDAHGSFNERIAKAFDTIVDGCSSSQGARQLCDQIKSLVHPHFPDDAPLLSLPDPQRTRPDVLSKPNDILPWEISTGPSGEL